MLRAVLAAFALGAAAIVAAAAALAGGAAPMKFELVFEGRHEITPGSGGALQHVGPFTASSPFCPSGNAVDVLGSPSTPNAVRRFTCDDGAGSILLRVRGFHGEHVTGMTGAWEIVSGTGQYAALRGKGAWTSVVLSGDPTRPETVTFRSTSTGAADFDAVAPRIAILRASAAKLRRPRGAYVIRLTVSLGDNVEGNVVSYRVTASRREFVLGSKTGRTASGRVAVALRLRPPKSSRSVRIRIEASDPLDNTRAVSRSLKLRS
jgi:hypothetical protein